MADWLNITMIEDLFFQGFVDVFGSSLIVFIFLLGFFAFLCYSGRLSVEESALVFIPLIFGVIQDGWLPLWVKALFIIAIAVIWAMAILRIIREG